MKEDIHISEKDVAAGHFTGGGYAFYRLPDADYYTFISQQGRPEELAALDVSDTFSGMVIAPFMISQDTPLILLHPDYSEIHRNSKDVEIQTSTITFTDDDDSRFATYEKSFEVCHSSIMEGRAGKIVLSRRMALHNTTNEAWNAVNLFHKACRRYPHNYISLWWTKRTGAWLIATPETLLRKTAEDQWQTMALAGTMKWDECKAKGFEKAWTKKNKEEQQYVATYIEHRLLPFVNKMSTSPTYTSQAADLAHLRTDFTFSLRQDAHLSDLLRRLHPTPAVCGVPQEVACQTILESEDSSRRYYAGFSGPVNWNHESQLYVSLRCMEISAFDALLYAGGGLLKDSNKEEEWTETQRKMHTMLRLFK